VTLSHESGHATRGMHTTERPDDVSWPLPTPHWQAMHAVDCSYASQVGIPGCTSEFGVRLRSNSKPILLVTGPNFESGGEYYCRFREYHGDKRFVSALADPVRPFVEGGGDRRSGISQIGDHWSYSDMPRGGLVCTVPPWPFRAQTVSFAIATSLYGDELVPLTGEAHESNFTYLEGWDSSAIERRGPASGGTLLEFSSCGLDATSAEPYTCRWERLVPQGMVQAMSSPADPVNETLMRCVTPAWGSFYPASNATVTIARGGRSLDDLASGATGEGTQAASAIIVTFEFYAVWVDWPQRPTISPYGGTALMLRGYGFSSEHACFCRYSGDQHVVNSNMSAAAGPALLTCSAPAWPRGSQMVQVSLYCAAASSGGASYDDALLVPLLDGRESGSVLYASAWQDMYVGGAGNLSAGNVTGGQGAGVEEEFKTGKVGLASGDEVLTIMGSGFLAGAVYECVFSSQHNVTAPMRTRATVRSSTQLECLTPVWGVADTVSLSISSVIACDDECRSNCSMCFSGGSVASSNGLGAAQACVRQCLIQHGGNADELELASAPVFPPGDVAKTLFRFVEAWSGMTLACGGSEGPASGGQLLNVAGFGFASGAAYKCVFARQGEVAAWQGGAGQMRTNVTVLNRTHASCMTPEWDAQETVHFYLELDLLPVYYDRSKCDSQCESECTESCPCSAQGCFYAFFSYLRSVVLPDRSFRGQKALLLSGGDSILFHGFAFNESLRANCTFSSADGSKLPVCSVPAVVLDSRRLLCVTRQCLSPTRQVILFVDGARSVDPGYQGAPGAPDAQCLAYVSGAPVTLVQLVLSWNSLRTDAASPVELAQGGNRIQLAGPGLNLADYTFNCTFLDYHSQVEGAVAEAHPNGTTNLYCVVPRYALACDPFFLW
jgi:hypothetical protein